MPYLLPEWYPQEAVILAWPDAQTDWQPWLAQVQQTYVALIQAISNHQCTVLLLVRKAQIEVARSLLKEQDKVLFITADYNDTWIRDYGFLSCQSAHGIQPIEFVFNGWGNKFNASKDNQVNQTYLAELCQMPVKSSTLVCEGGALEIDEHQNVLSTRLCLTNPQRNGKMSLHEYEAVFAQYLGAQQSHIFTHGHLEGDDTDGHIDTLVRFAEQQGLVIQSCFNRPSDSHFNGLSALVTECQEIFPAHSIFQLPLPYVENEQGERLPASYANYLINNEQILAPVYQQPEDKIALDVLASAYPKHNIVAIDALPLVQQFGSIHCISMQVPVGTLKSEVLAEAKQGLAEWRGATK